MIFSSIQYLIFLPLVVFAYWRTKGGARLLLLLAASYYFYMSWLPVYGILLLFLTAANWLLGIGIQSLQTAAAQSTTGDNQQKSPVANGKSWFLLMLGLVLNLGCLCYYKYANFFISNLALGFNFSASHLHLNHVHLHPQLFNLLLPLGISFFIFEFVHYLVDVYRGNKAIKSFMEFAVFSAFFPSQIAGPIKRYEDFMVKLLNPLSWSNHLFHESMGLILRGLFKKVAIADPIGYIVNTGFIATAPLSSSDALIASIGFVVQVYCDFSGYTDIGRGSALLLGIRLPENFNLPYLSHDLSDFWRRWHMSLGTWLRDYLYIPLGGSRGNSLSHWRNLFITMTACGLWHGADWHYVIFGAMQGAGLIVNREWKVILDKVRPLKALLETFVFKQLGTLVTMAFITISFIVFRAPDLPHALNVFSSIFNFTGNCTLADDLWKSGIVQLLCVYLMFWATMVVSRRRPELLTAIFAPQSGFHQPVRLAAWTAATLLMIAAKPVEATPFVYFQF